MNWQRWLAEGRIRKHRVNPDEIRDLLEIADRDIRDASIAGLSSDRRFATAYNSILQLATVVLRLHGYRIAGQGHHAMTFRALGHVKHGIPQHDLAYYDSCRRKRNLADYDAAGHVSEAEVGQILFAAKKLRATVANLLDDVNIK